jgi:site-specific DNA-adenine methylase
LSEDGLEQSTYKQGQDGSTFVEKKQHHLLKTLESLHTQKMKMLKSFRATRESKDVERDVYDISARLDKIRKQAQGQKSRGQGSDR